MGRVNGKYEKISGYMPLIIIKMVKKEECEIEEIKNHGSKDPRLQRIENLQIHYAKDFYTFMDSVLAVSVSTGLLGADAIHFVWAISLPEVNEIITLDRHFKRVKDQIKVTILSEGVRWNED